jgi:hypothetical protein
MTQESSTAEAKVQLVKVLEPKRSNAVGILISTLPPLKDIKTAIALLDEEKLTREQARYDGRYRCHLYCRYGCCCYDSRYDDRYDACYEARYDACYEARYDACYECRSNERRWSRFAHSSRPPRRSRRYRSATAPTSSGISRKASSRWRYGYSDGYTEGFLKVALWLQ